jgi:hypothetical protein
MSLPGIEPLFLGRQLASLVIAPTDLFRLLVNVSLYTTFKGVIPLAWLKSAYHMRTYVKSNIWKKNVFRRYAVNVVCSP